jgi:PKD repeat protein
LGRIQAHHIMHRRSLVALALVVLAPLVMAAAVQPSMSFARTNLAASQVSPSAQTSPTLSVWRVFVRDDADVQRLTSGEWDVLEARGSIDGVDYLLVLGDDAVADALRAQGYRVELHETIPTGSLREPFTYYYGYHSVAEHEQHINAVVAARPDLAQRIDYGDSWWKQQGRPDGHDLIALCLTRQHPGDCALNPASSKPRFLLLAGVHARELVPPELAWRWIDEVVNGDGVDPDITALLDHTELWIVPIANPDGRVIVEAGGNSPVMQRKNANTTYGSCSIPYIGVDLNRNGDFKWGGPGASTAPCNNIYRGPNAASEPEASALIELMGNLFHDQRGPGDTDAPPSTATGLLLSLHSDGNMAMTPWDWTSNPPPNYAELLAVAYRLSYFNGYRTGRSGQILYISSGTLDDWIYGRLGIANITFEVGSSFIPAYSSIDSTLWPLNRGALRYSAKLARQPYTLAQGPAALTPALSLSSVPVGTALTLTAWIDDQRLGTNGTASERPTTQPISQAEYYVDAPPWDSGTAHAMRSADGSLNSAREQMTASVDTCLELGRHTLFVRGRDTSGHWGPTIAAWLNVTPTSTTLSGTVRDRLTGAPLAATLNITSSQSSAVIQTDPAGFYSFTISSGPTYTVSLAAPDYLTETHTLWVSACTGNIPTGNFVLVPAGFANRTLLPVINYMPIVSPVADFSATPLRGYEPLTVTFTNLTSGDYSDNLWDFGDGETSTLPHPTHIYTSAGVYTVTLTVNGPGGASTLTRADAITVTPSGFHWLDATAGGTVVAMGDDTYQAVTLPFPFTFYGNTYTRTFVSSNGYISFGNGYASYAHGCLPIASSPNNAIYALWTDLAPSGGENGNVYIKATDADTFVIEWHAVKQFSPPAQQTFEIVLRRDHSITLQYHTVSDTCETTAGIENSTGAAAQQFWCNGAGTPITNSLALRATTITNVADQVSVAGHAARRPLSSITQSTRRQATHDRLVTQ